MSELNELPEGYKMTELGPLPQEWQVVRLGEVCRFQGGTQPSKGVFIYEPREGYIRLLQIRDYESDDKATYIPKNGRLRLVSAEDVLIARYGASVGKILRGKEGAINVAIVKTIPHPQKLISDFLYYRLQEDDFQKFVKGLGGRAAQAGFNKGELNVFPIPLPPLAEQRAIAHVLRTVQQARQATERVIAALRDLKKSLMRHLFTYGPVGVGTRHAVSLRDTELGPLPEHWQVVRLGEVASVDWGNTSLTKAIYQSYGYPAFSASGMDGYLDFFEHDGEAVIVSAIGARCGKCFFARGKWTAIKNTIIVKANDRACNHFLYFYLDDESKWPRSGSGQPFISLGKARDILIPLPPLAEQQEIARILQAVDRRIAAEEAKSGALQELFKTLLRELMTGRRRVVVGAQRRCAPTRVAPPEEAP